MILPNYCSSFINYFLTDSSSISTGKFQQEMKQERFFTMMAFICIYRHTIVRNIPNSLSMSTTSPSVKVNWGFFFFLHWSTICICWAATDKTGSSMRLNSSKQPHAPDWAKPKKSKKGNILLKYQLKQE